MACINVPTIVAEGSFLSQTSNLDPTVIYSVSTAGIYRVTIIVSPSSGIGDDNGDEIAWSVDASLSYTSNVGSVSSSDFGSGAIYCAASSNISIGSALQSVSNPSFLYNLFYAVEAL